MVKQRKYLVARFGKDELRQTVFCGYAVIDSEGPICSLKPVGDWVNYLYSSRLDIGPEARTRMRATSPIVVHNALNRPYTYFLVELENALPWLLRGFVTCDSCVWFQLLNAAKTIKLAGHGNEELDSLIKSLELHERGERAA